MVDIELAWSPALARPTQQEIHQLLHLLWDLDCCEKCLDSSFGWRCTTATCVTPLLPSKFESFSGYYKRLCAAYDPDLYSSMTSPISHENIRLTISAIQRCPGQSKQSFVRELSSITADSDYSEVDRDDAGEFVVEQTIELAVSIMTMVNCLRQDSSTLVLEEGCNRVPWRLTVPFSSYIELVLPQRQTSSSKLAHFQSFLDASSPAVTAKALERAARTSFRGTNDITNHLRYDAVNNIVFIFHHAAFLKQQLRLSNDHREGSNTSSPMRSTLPRQYVLEVLQSIQTILFPLWDAESVALLQSLVTSSGFDKEILNDQNSFLRDNEERIEYYYLGQRLDELHQEILQPRPRGWLQSTFERRSGPRHVMLMTFAGVVIAVLLGMASLVVTIFQTYITYQAWKHPG